MEITYIGHSCFLAEDKNASIIFDPYKPGSVPGLKDIDIKASQIFCSHSHSDHSGAEYVTQTDSAEKFEVTLIHTYHDEVKGRKRGLNDITIAQKDGIKIVHMGDIGCNLEPEQIDLLKNADVLLIPVGGFYTIDAEEAYKLVMKINPKITIPMHYRGDAFGYDEIAPVDDFVKLCSKEKVIYSSDSVVNLDNLVKGSFVIMKGLNQE